MSWKDLHDIAIDLIICPLCNALSGDWCKTVTGRRAKYPHESRMWPVRQAYALGWEDGKEDTFRMAGQEGSDA
jgi:hypothetical protein